MNECSFSCWHPGGEVGQFSSPNDVAIDSTGRIYVVDTGNGRIVRMDDMSGTNWVSFGSLGDGVGHFHSLEALSVDSQGKIYSVDLDVSRDNWSQIVQITP